MQKKIVKSSYVAKKGLSSSSTQQCKTGLNSVRATCAGTALGRAPGLLGLLGFKPKQTELVDPKYTYVLPNQLSRIHNHRT